MCVHFRYGSHILSLETFLGSSSTAFRTRLSFPYASRLLVFRWWICLPSRYLACTSSSSRWLQLPLSVIPSHIYEYRNLYLLSIDYASRPRLRSRLTQSGRTFLWKPWVFGAWDSHPRAATHTGILSSSRSTCPCDHASSLTGTLPYHLYSLYKSIASVLCLAPVNFRRRVIRPVSCYALFKGWLLLSQPPGCLDISTSFST